MSINIVFSKLRRKIFFRMDYISYVLVAHVPVGPLPERHDLPHDDAVAPHVRGRRELPERDGLRRRPADGNLPALFTTKERQE